MLNNKFEHKGILSKRLLELEVFTFMGAIQFVKKKHLMEELLIEQIQTWF